MLTPLISALLLAGLILTGAAVLAILMNNQEGALREFAVLGLFCAALMLLSYYMELNIPGFPAKLTSVKFGYIGRVFCNPMLFMLVLRYYGLRLSKLVQALLYLIPSVTLFLVFNCEKYDLYYADVSLMRNGLLLIIPGPFYMVYMAFNLMLAMLCIAVCLYQRRTLRRREDKINNTLLLSACIMPLLSLLAYLAGLTGGYDISSLGVLGGALLIALAIIRFGLLNKEEMLQNMATGLIFLDNDYQLVYANRKAAEIIPALDTEHNRDGSSMDLSQLCEPEFAAIQSGGASYQRKITEWSSGDGRHGKLLTFDDITEIRSRLNRDAMTGLLNHATFYPMLDSAMTENTLNGHPVTVSIADIDSFKRINDTYGHANGDIILIDLAKTLKEICGRCGDVFRYGGEEFSVIFRCHAEEAEKVMQEALDTFSAHTFPFMDGNVTFSYGSAEYEPTETSVALFDRADQIMYGRKRALHAKENSEKAKAAPITETVSAEKTQEPVKDNAATAAEENPAPEAQTPAVTEIHPEAAVETATKTAPAETTETVTETKAEAAARMQSQPKKKSKKGKNK